MKLKIQSIHFDADIKLLNFINEKAEKLDLLNHGIIDGEVYLRLDKADTNENKIVEIKLNLPGKVLFAKEHAKSFEAATDSAIEALKKQVTKHKEKVREN